MVVYMAIIFTCSDLQFSYLVNEHNIYPADV